MKWSERILRAETNKRFGFSDRKLADDFRYCAVGEKLGLQNVSDEGGLAGTLVKKLDPDLWTLGIKFGISVRCNDIDETKLLYKTIMEFKF